MHLVTYYHTQSWCELTSGETESGKQTILEVVIILLSLEDSL